MATTLICEQEGPMGQAIYDYYKKGKAGRLRVFSSQFDEDEIPVKELFRTYEQMPVVDVTRLSYKKWGKMFRLLIFHRCLFR